MIKMAKDLADVHRERIRELEKKVTILKILLGISIISLIILIVLMIYFC